MLNREIPFRPKLEGDFRVRFYNAVSEIDEQTSPIRIEEITNDEISWVQNVCTYNLDQRKKYRAVWMLFRDLTRASWKACYRNGVLYMVEAMGIEPMSESRFRSISTSVAFPFNSRLCTPKSRLTESVAQKTFSGYEQVRRMFTADRRLFRDRSPSRADGWDP